jgi:hypothetical protein
LTGFFYPGARLPISRPSNLFACVYGLNKPASSDIITRKGKMPNIEAIKYACYNTRQNSTKSNRLGNPTLQLCAQNICNSNTRRVDKLDVERGILWWMQPT